MCGSGDLRRDGKAAWRLEMTTLEIIEKYARECRQRIRRGQKANYYWEKTKLAPKLEGRLEACETILARMTREQT